jgi:hypothetical protein
VGLTIRSTLNGLPLQPKYPALHHGRRLTMIAKWSIFSAMLLPVCAAIWAIQDFPQIRPLSWVSHLACLAIGALLILIPMQMNAGKRQTRNTNDQKHNVRGHVYSLSHARLNVGLPPPTMWMNMGYWTVSHS